MGRLAQLRHTLGTMAGQPGTECVVVDYSCPDHCGDWVEKNHAGVKIVRLAQESIFCISHARNLGAGAAAAPWLCFVDADVGLAADFAAKVTPLLEPGTFLLADPWVRELMGTFLCSRKDFERAGGFDEVLQNWGGEDRDFYFSLMNLGVIPKSFPSQWLIPIPHEDHLRAANYAIKDLRVSQAINSLYIQAKFDLIRLQGRLDLEKRQQLYKEANRVVQDWLVQKKPVQWRIEFQKKNTWLGPEIQCSLAYTFHGVESG